MWPANEDYPSDLDDLLNIDQYSDHDALTPAVEDPTRIFDPLSSLNTELSLPSATSFRQFEDSDAISTNGKWILDSALDEFDRRSRVSREPQYSGRTADRHIGDVVGASNRHRNRERRRSNAPYERPSRVTAAPHSVSFDPDTNPTSGWGATEYKSSPLYARDWGCQPHPPLVPSTSDVTPQLDPPQFVPVKCSGSTTPTALPPSAFHSTAIYPDAGDYLRKQLQLPPDVPVSLWSIGEPANGGKPNVPLPMLIKLALYGCEKKKLTLQEIYREIIGRFRWFKEHQTQTSWKNSIRHNLSLNKVFKPEARPMSEVGKGCYWTLDVSQGEGNKRPRKRQSRANRNASGDEGYTSESASSVSDSYQANGDPALRDLTHRRISNSGSSPPQPCPVLTGPSHTATRLRLQEKESQAGCAPDRHNLGQGPQSRSSSAARATLSNIFPGKAALPAT
ncbi:hypothetical protein B0H10DRAFT_515771 [Mycena sp. CBHHK59/15]|nr:hypothetical protein B0H10DRAFT_515771 [Mycena sp. CBHHK59/15]